MKKTITFLLLIVVIMVYFCGCSNKNAPEQNSSYVDIDQFEDSGENIIPSTPNAYVTMPDNWAEE